jgi:hypothetical protein
MSHANNNTTPKGRRGRAGRAPWKIDAARRQEINAFAAKLFAASAAMPEDALGGKSLLEVNPGLVMQHYASIYNGDSDSDSS